MQQALPRDFHLLLGRRGSWLILQWRQGKVLQALKKRLCNQQAAGCFQHVVSYIIPCEATGTGASWLENPALMVLYTFFPPGLDESMRKAATAEQDVESFCPARIPELFTEPGTGIEMRA